MSDLEVRKYVGLNAHMGPRRINQTKQCQNVKQHLDFGTK